VIERTGMRLTAPLWIEHVVILGPVELLIERVVILGLVAGVDRAHRHEVDSAAVDRARRHPVAGALWIEGVCVVRLIEVHC